ncbi:hypothetical protein, partial [uncultured Limnobacter sp.]|uniref:hypothetical protein n=2 Tax=Limnobacter TaxID=131079 RepID=UPI0032B29720
AIGGVHIRQNRRPSLGVGMKPTTANQFKRGGFLEVRPKQSHCRVGLNRRLRIFTSAQLTAGFKAQSAAVFRSPRLQENLPV